MRQMQLKLYQSPGYHTFFGYYDKPNISKDRNIILANRTKTNEDINYGDKLEIGYFLGGDTTNFNVVAETSSWNWQQGAMLQFWDESYETLVFNYLDGDEVRAKICTLNGNIVRDKLPPIYFKNITAPYYYSLNFKVLSACRVGYDYKIKDLGKNFGQPYISKVSIDDGKEEILITLKDLIRETDATKIAGEKHYFEHISESPNGKYVLFMHRWFTKGGELHTHLYRLKEDGGLINLSPSGRASHFNWIDNSNIICFMGDTALANSIRSKYSDYLIYKIMKSAFKKIFSFQSAMSSKVRSEGYFIFDVNKKNSEKIQKLSNLNDGHPTKRFGNSLITDTYPDKNLEQRIYWYNFTDNSLRLLFEDRVQTADGVNRCDFHPRLSPCEKLLSFDLHKNASLRAIAVMNLLT